MATPARAFKLLRDAGISPAQAVILTAIGGAESGWNENALGDQSLETAKWGPSVGIWQIRTLKAQTGTGGPRDINVLRGNPSAQAHAVRVVLHAQGLGAWSTYRNGTYKQFLGTRKNHNPTGKASSSSTSATAQPVFDLSPINPLDLIPGINPFHWGGALAAGAGEVIDNGLSAAGKATAEGFASGGKAIWGVVQPFALTGMFAVGGIVLVIVGASITAKPTTDKLREQLPDPSDAAQLAPLLAV